MLGCYDEPAFNILTPSQCYAGRIVRCGGELRFYHWIKDRFQGKKERYLAPPKLVEIRDRRIFFA